MGRGRTRSKLPEAVASHRLEPKDVGMSSYAHLLLLYSTLLSLFERNGPEVITDHESDRGDLH